MNRILRTNGYLRKFKEYRDLISNLKTTPSNMVAKNCRDLSIKNVLDIGANAGQFGVDLRRNGFLGHIYSYEPVSHTFELLTKTSKNDPLWSVFPLALGKEIGSSVINVSGNDGLSSSVFPMKEVHRDAFPKSSYEYTEAIQISTLENELSKLAINPKETLLKMDVQGFEKNVILGGNRVLGNVAACYFEASLSPLYEGEANLLELLNLLDAQGHVLAEIFRGARDKTGNLLQVDVFTRLRVN